MNKEKVKMVIEIDNLTPAQKIAIEDILATWVSLGHMGSSRWTAFYADGDGNFHPKVTVDGEQAKMTELGDRQKRWKQIQNVSEDDWFNCEAYMIDFDEIAWALRKEDE